MNAKTLALKTLTTSAVLTAALAGTTGVAFAQDVAPAPQPTQPSGPDKVAPAPQPTKPAGPDKVAPAPQPTKPPAGPKDIAPAPAPKGPKGPGDIAPAPHDPKPQGPGDLADAPKPHGPHGPDDLGNPTGCLFTHGCPDGGDTDGGAGGQDSDEAFTGGSAELDGTSTDAAGNGLPFTGGSSLLMLEIAGGLLATGTVALVVARRRKSTV